MKKIIYGFGIVIFALIMFFNVAALNNNNNTSEFTLEDMKASACDSMEGIQAVIKFMEDCMCYNEDNEWVSGCQDAQAECGYN